MVIIIPSIFWLAFKIHCFHDYAYYTTKKSLQFACVKIRNKILKTNNGNRLRTIIVIDGIMKAVVFEH